MKKKTIEEDIQKDIFENNNENIIINKISLNEYLSLYNRRHVLDDIIRKWFLLQDKTNPKKNKEEWDTIINKFHSETE